MDLVINSTYDQIEEFKESLLWADICRELETWKRGFELEGLSIVDDAAANNPSTASVLLHMGDINGRSKAVDYMMGILDMFMQLLEDRKNAQDRSNFE